MDDDMYVSGVPALCLHCGKLTISRIRTQYIPLVSEKLYSGKIDIKHIKWTLLQCPECLRPTLLQTEEISKRVYDTWERTLVAIRSLYPLEKQIPSSLPKKIEKMYAEAIKVQILSPSSCAVLVRRTLEAVCQHENATGRTLADKLKNLADTGKIPQTLVDIVVHLRQLGNLGAHLDMNDDITTEDVPIILDFVELLLEYLYVAPAKIQTVKDRLNNPRKNSSLTTDGLDNDPF